MKKRIQYRLAIVLSVWIVLSCCLAVLTEPVFSQQAGAADPAYLFYKGNALYEEGNYDGAIHEFTELLDQGLESGALYYNIGNCYVKKGEIGRAILYYERARRMIPRDSDLKSNYSFALSQLDYDISGQTSWSGKFITGFDVLSLNEMTVLVSVVFALLVLFFILRLFIHGCRRYTIVVTACVICTLLLLSIPLADRIHALDAEAVVITEKPEVRFEPFDTATTHFTLYAGMKVTVVESQKEWVKIRRADGKAGWIKSGDIEQI